MDNCLNSIALYEAIAKLTAKVNELVKVVNDIQQGDAPVKSVNGLIGDVVLSGSNVNVSNNNSSTIQQKFAQLDQAASQYYSPQNVPPYPVTSVNGMTGDVELQTGGGGQGTVTSVNDILPINGNVQLTGSDIKLNSSSNDNLNSALMSKYGPNNQPPYPLYFNEYQSKNGVNFMTNGNRYSVSYSSDSLSFSIDNVIQYFAYTTKNTPPYPVLSVNGMIGDIQMDMYISLSTLSTLNVKKGQNIHIYFEKNIDGVLPYGSTLTLPLLNLSGDIMSGSYAASFAMDLNYMHVNINGNSLILYITNNANGPGINQISGWLTINIRNNGYISKYSENNIFEDTQKPEKN